MTVLAANIQWIMLVSGLLTCTMLYAAVAPKAAARGTFGETVSGPAAELIVRNWGILIGLVGIMLIVGAFQPAVRPLVLMVAGVSKLVFIGLVLAHGRRFLKGAGAAVVIDSLMVMLFAIYLIGER